MSCPKGNGSRYTTKEQIKKPGAEPRRLVMKAEWLPKGANPRFVLTNMELPLQELYDQFYVQRGSDSEHRIKELKLGIRADRLSCSSFIPNQFESKLFLFVLISMIFRQI